MTFRSAAPPRWRNPRFMPRWASRLLLEIVEVRAQRLHDITEADALKEGVCSALIPADEFGPPRIGFMYGRDDGRSTLHPEPQDAYAAAWNLMHRKRAPWETNPWVFATTFRVISTDGKRP